MYDCASRLAPGFEKTAQLVLNVTAPTSEGLSAERAFARVLEPVSARLRPAQSRRGPEC
jgi:hypothetical protein